MEGTDAAGELLLNPQTCAALLSRLAGAGFVGKPFESLLEFMPVAGGSANTKLLSVQAPLP